MKVQSLFDDRDVNFDPVNKAEFKNQAQDLIDVYYLVTDRQEEYQYDAGGNRSQATITTRQGKQTNYEYYPNSNRLMANGEYGFSYDANGNLIAKGTNYTNSGTSLKIQPEGEYWNYHYDLLNRLIAVEKNGKTITAYKYNEQGLRIKKLALETTTYYSFNQPYHYIDFIIKYPYHLAYICQLMTKLNSTLFVHCPPILCQRYIYLRLISSRSCYFVLYYFTVLLKSKTKGKNPF